MGRYALLVGVSEYESKLLNNIPSAAADVEKLQTLLEKADRGHFDSVISLPNPSRIDFERKVAELFRDRQKDDLVLLFFSGHGVIDAASKLYFGLPETQVNEKEEPYKETTTSAQFIHDLMNDCRASQKAIILDCCFASKFTRKGSGRTVTSALKPALEHQLGGKGCVILAASSTYSYSSEDPSSLSLYTNSLVQGIESGKADLDKDGYIKARELNQYIAEDLKNHPKHPLYPKIFSEDEGFDISISKSGLTRKKAVPDQGIINTPLSLQQSLPHGKETLFLPVTSSLRMYVDLIEKLINTFESKVELTERAISLEKPAELVKISLDVIREALEAHIVFYVKQDSGEKWNIHQSSYLSDGISEEEYFEFIRRKVFDGFSLEKVFQSGYRGLEKKENFKQSPTRIVIVPEYFYGEPGLLCVCGLPDRQELKGDVFTQILNSFYKATVVDKEKPRDAEASIIDQMKVDYGYLPFGLYEKRFGTFKRRLAETTTYFEPILNIDERYISGWEALARDIQTEKTPVDLFRAAELWGSEFTTELDLHFLETALTRYTESRIKNKIKRSSEIAELSINVYPQTLLRSVYFEALRKFTGTSRQTRLLPPRKLVLELSEKADLPTFDKGIPIRKPVEKFRERLRKLSSELKIRCCIDDFGVGHASIERLNAIQTPYIKLDREIVLHKSSKLVVNFLKDIVSNFAMTMPSAIVLEGVDEECSLSLKDIQEMNITFVQGYRIGKAKSEIYDRLDENHYRELFNFD